MSFGMFWSPAMMMRKAKASPSTPRRRAGAMKLLSPISQNGGRR